MITVDSESFLTVVAVGAIAAFAAGLIGPRLTIPVVVLEIVLGILVGPELLGFAEPDDFLDFFPAWGWACSSSSRATRSTSSASAEAHSSWGRWAGCSR
jgi:hypothetical protein